MSPGDEEPPPIFAPKLSPEEREIIRKFGGHDRTMGIYVEAQRCQLEPRFPGRCPKRWSQLPHECGEHLGHRDSGTPHRCRCGRTWMDGELRRNRRKTRRKLRGTWWQRMVKAWKDADPGPSKSDDDDDDWEMSIW